jgi:hypothetical protein
MTHFGIDSWSFPPASDSTVSRTVQFTPRLVINTVRGAVSSAVEGYGITRVFSYQVAEQVREGRLGIVLADHEHPPLPVHLISPHGRLSVPKVRAFVDFAVPQLLRSSRHRLSHSWDRYSTTSRNKRCLANSFSGAVNHRRDGRCIPCRRAGSSFAQPTHLCKCRNGYIGILANC